MPRPRVEFPIPRDLGPREWGRELLIVETPEYIGKRLEMKAGAAGGLQYHRRKVESFLLVSGTALLEYDSLGDGEDLDAMPLVPGTMVHVPAGAVHRVTAVTDCTFLEWSTPVFNDRVRCEAEYNQPETGGLPTAG